MVGTEATKPAIEVRNLNLRLDLGSTKPMVVSDINFSIAPGETLCIIGESGSGKTLTALSLLQLLPGAVTIDSGVIEMAGEDLTRLNRKQLSDRRGDKLAMIFQEPMTSLNPVATVGKQIAEAVLRHRKVSKEQAWARAVEMLDLVGLKEPELQAKSYPHQLSGGMRQRVMIAMALACEPSVLVADEPTTALDVSVQSQILRLIRSLQTRMGTAVLLITHDFGVVAEVADRVIVMYAGREVEAGPVLSVFDEPLHPYTRGLLAAAPHLRRDGEVPEKLNEIPGVVPRPDALPEGCAFAPRCALAVERCHKERPPLVEKREGHASACWVIQ